MCLPAPPLHVAHLCMSIMLGGRSTIGASCTTSTSARAPTSVNMAASASTHPTPMQASQYDPNTAGILGRSITETHYVYDHHPKRFRRRAPGVSASLPDTYHFPSTPPHGEKGWGIQYRTTQAVSWTIVLRIGQHRRADGQTVA